MTSPEVVVILQARVGSSRLPGKVLAPIADRSILGHCVHRLRASGVGDVIVATTRAPQDDAVVDEAQRYGALVARGPEDDVLARFIAALPRQAPQFVVRATADNPAVDIDAPVRTVSHLRTSGVVYVVEPDLPYGSAVEAMTLTALREADRLAVAASDREHVTPFIARHRARFPSVRPSAPLAIRRPDLRFTVDTAGDLEYMRRVFAEADGAAAPVSLSALVSAADRLASAADVA